MGKDNKLDAFRIDTIFQENIIELLIFIWHPRINKNIAILVLHQVDIDIGITLFSISVVIIF